MYAKKSRQNSKSWLFTFLSANYFSALQAVVDQVVLGGLTLADVPALQHDHLFGLALGRVQGYVLGLFRLGGRRVFGHRLWRRIFFVSLEKLLK